MQTLRYDKYQNPVKHLDRKLTFFRAKVKLMEDQKGKEKAHVS